MHYYVTWAIDIDAESAFEAAKQAWAIQKDQASIASVFQVTDESGKQEMVDLIEE